MLDVLTPEEVLAMIEREFAPLAAHSELVPLASACGRVLSEAISAEEYVPDFDRSTVDGYALRASDTFGCSEAIPAILPVAGEIHMGEGAMNALASTTCVAVPTGGALPQGADSVVMIEYTENYGDGLVGVLKPTAPGQNVIFRGDDVCPGRVLLEAGHRLGASDIGAMAAIGRHQVPVVKRLRVGIISTGDEIVPVEAVPRAGQVRDVNSAMLAAMLASFGAEPVPYGVVADDEEALRAQVDAAIASCDAVLLSGGSSVGKKDATSRVIAEHGGLLMHGIAMKPGKPTILGRAGLVPLVGLPGHPMAAFFVTKLVVEPLLARLEGRRLRHYTVAAKLSESISANHGRAQYLACRLERDEEGWLAVPIRGKSGLITTLAGADGFFGIDRDAEGLPQYARVQVRVFGGE